MTITKAVSLHLKVYQNVYVQKLINKGNDCQAETLIKKICSLTVIVTNMIVDLLSSLRGKKINKIERM